MIRISLTDFLDFVVAGGRPKITKVKQIKTRADYHPNFDYYKQLRDAIVDYHEQNTNDKSYFDAFLKTSLTDEKKTKKYQHLVNHYKKILGKKKCESVSHKKIIWTYDELEVSVNPELCLKINGEKNLIKLYFKSEKLSKLKTDVIPFLMKHALPNIKNVDYYTIFDLHNNKILKENNPDQTLKPLLFAEAQHFLTLYKNID